MNRPIGKEYVPFVSAAERKRRREAELQAQQNKRRGIEDGGGVAQGEGNGTEEAAAAEESLFDISHDIKTEPDYEARKKSKEQEVFLAQVTAKQKALMSAQEKAAGGRRWVSSLETGWRPLRRVRALSHADQKHIRDKLHILVEGEDVPPPCRSFRSMRLPKVIVSALREKGISKPSPIQLQGLPVALSGRDMIGIAFTGSGKTLCFSLPMVMMALGEELKLPLQGGEGPFAVILGPSRELMNQTFEVVTYLCDAIKESSTYPELRPVLAIGGMDKRAQVETIRQSGAHMVVATPGRLNDFLQRGDLNLDFCRYFCLDEGDRMVADEGFEEELQRILGYCKVQRQTLLFSATMPKKIIDFAQNSLVRPVTVNVGRAGAANQNILQQVEFVKAEAKVPNVLQSLQKSPPPVVIFSDSKRECDEIYEYLLLKGVEAVAIHGGKDQDDRNTAIKQFKSLEKDVLVATDVAAKGLDFPDIQHVINFNMPKEIENYVHRIGRTGRGGKKGIATTYVNNHDDPSVLMDLKHLLKEAKQVVPDFLWSEEDEKQAQLAAQLIAQGKVKKDAGCAFCGGLGHDITTCPKLQNSLKSQQAAQRDVVGTAAYGGNW